jgi:hypothetical protein
MPFTFIHGQHYAFKKQTTSSPSNKGSGGKGWGAGGGGAALAQRGGDPSLDVLHPYW